MDTSAYQIEILSKLQPLGKPDQVNAVRNVTRTRLEVLAIKVPVLREVVKAEFSFYDLPMDKVLAIWNDIWFSSPYYEVMSAALMYYESQGKKISPETWPCLSTWHHRIENWAHCDSLGSIYSYLLAKRPDEVYSQLQIWNVSDEEWLRRLSLVSLIHHAGKKTDFLPLDKILPLVTHIITDQRHYVSRAVGWLLREAAKGYHGEIRAYIEEYMALMPSVAFSYAIEHYSPEERKDIVARRRLLRAEKVG